MGVLYLDGAQVGDDGRLAFGRIDRATRESGEAARRERDCDAMRRAKIAMEAPARRLAAHLAKNAARMYRRNPSLLDAISHGLSASAPRRILAVCDHIQERRQRDGGNPFGALTRPANLAGARVYSRWLRRFGERDEFLEAAE